MSLLSEIEPSRFEGPGRANEYALRSYGRGRRVLGELMEQGVRGVGGYRHSCTGAGRGILGAGILPRQELAERPVPRQRGT